MTDHDYARLVAIAEQIHDKRHQGTCADMDPRVHRDHMAGIYRRAAAILEAERSRCAA